MKYFWLRNHSDKYWTGVDRGIIREASDNAVDFIGLSIEFFLKTKHIHTIYKVEATDVATKEVQNGQL